MKKSETKKHSSTYIFWALPIVIKKVEDLQNALNNTDKRIEQLPPYS